MTALPLALSFDETGLGAALDAMTDADRDDLDFGLIGFDAASIVCRYNRHEADAAGLPPGRVLGRPLFTDVAPCMNNFMVAQRFHDAARDQVALDVTIPYVLTLRMKPVPVVLRLIAAPAPAHAYVLVRRAAR